MDYQLLTFFILAIITVAIVALVIYLILLIREVRTTIQKANQLLDNAKGLSSFVSNPLTSIASIITGVVTTIKEIRKDTQ